MRHSNPFKAYRCIAFLIILFSFGCKSDAAHEEKSSQTGEKEKPGSVIQVATFEDENSEAPKKVPAAEKVAKAIGADGILLEKASFWIGRPGESNSEILSLEEDTKLKVLSLENEYFKVAFEDQTGYIKRNAIQIVRPDVPSRPERKPDDTPTKPVVTKETAAGTVAEEPEESASELTPCMGALGEELLPGVSCVQYRERVLEKVNTLEAYIERIIDKTEINRSKSVDLACQLFVNEQAMVIATSLNNPSSARPIRKYLNGLMALSYDKVEIEWTNIQYVSDLRKGPDGKYFGYVHIEQTFKGFIDGRLVYGDITEKIMTVVLETYEVLDPRGNYDTRWDVFLSDIGVVQTKKLG